MAKLVDKQSIPAVIAEMTVEEKALLLTGRTSFSTYPIERLGIPSATVLDGGTGVNFGQLFGDLFNRALMEQKIDRKSLSGLGNSAAVARILSTLECGEKLSEADERSWQLIRDKLREIVPSEPMPGAFPPGMLLAATWEEESPYLCASAIAREMDVFHVDMVLGSPNVNIHRDPLGGRVFEGYSEDPYLTARLAPSFVKGTQDEGLIANAKHYAANNQETHRQNINEIIPERALYEIYFPGFKACAQAGAKSFMSAYNKINGTACAMNRWLLTDVLRGEFGFEGLVVSDWGGAYDQAKAIAAGNDLDMPGPRDIELIVQAIQDGSLKMEELDLAVERMLEMLLDMPVMKGRRYTQIDREYSRAACYRADCEGIVLLKNEGLLPLARGTKLSFVGEGCKKFIETGGGSAQVYTNQSTGLIEECAKITGAQNCRYGSVAQDSDALVVTVSAWGQEGCDRAAMDIEPEDKAMLLEAIAKAKAMGKKVIVLLNVAGPVDVSEYVDDVDAMLLVFFPGMEGAHATADILFGNVNPSGKLPTTFPVHYIDCPTFGNFPGCAAEVCYGEGIFVGYRYYDTRGVEPMFPFGHGLSYSRFEIGNLRLDRKAIDLDKDEKLIATVTVKNVSDIDGKEVVQLYIADPKSTLVKPAKELKGFEKVLVKAGEARDVSFEIDKASLASYDPEWKCWISEAGKYEVLVGNSSRAIAAKAEFVAKAVTPYNYNAESMLIVVMQDPRAKGIIGRYFAQIGVDMDDLDDCLYYFPHRALGSVLNRMMMNATDNDARQAKRYVDKIIEELHELDLSVLG